MTLVIFLETFGMGSKDGVFGDGEGDGDGDGERESGDEGEVGSTCGSG